MILLRISRWIGLALGCALAGGCLMNSVHSIRTVPRAGPDRAHAFVVIGVGLDQPWPYTAFPLTFPEYSLEKQRITGNCFVYNRVEVLRPSAPSAVTYLVYAVPANAYLLQSLLHLVDEGGAPSPGGNGFIAPPGGVVYAGDYVFAGHETLGFRRDLAAARAATSKRLPPRTHVELAELITAPPGARMPLCTP